MMIYRSLAIRCLLSVLLLLAVGQVSAQPQSVNGFACTYSSDSSDWKTLTHPVSLQINDCVPIGFDFAFGGKNYSLMTFTTSWYLQLASEDMYGQYNGPQLTAINPSVRFTVFSSLYSVSGVQYQLLGYEGDRTLVVQFAVLYYNADTLCKLQLQLDEYEGSFRVMITPPSMSALIALGVSLGDGRSLSANTFSHNFSGLLNYTEIDSVWHNYLFVPESPVCPEVRDLHVESVTHSSARVKWHSNVLHSQYTLEYGQAGFLPGFGSTVVASGSELLLPDLLPGALYDVRLTAACCTGAADRTASCRFKTYCAEPHGNQIYFANLHDSNVVCQVGNFSNPDQTQHVADYGSDTSLSRHTVHYDLSETDPRTGGSLLTIPDGHCMSVRLGNSLTGSQEESVTYFLHIDTNDYDLLILRYAVVEEDPDHPLEMQPKFLFSINDSAGNPISSCYSANFVAGNASGWNEYRTQFGSLILWRDWQAVGIDLAPLHGRTIQVKLSNYDCDAGGHYGYAYYTLESARKTFETTFCGDAETNVFYAPAGFNYRWYSLDAPNVTLSTDDHLQVSGSGSYGCWVSYNLSGSSCGFAMSTASGPRYPAAIFQSSPLDDCGSTIQFVNHSCVASDQVHGGLTNEPCTQYLWRFGDGTTSEAVNPIHTFPNGTYTVELVAMLANGACRDSVRQTIVVDMESDTDRVTICPESQYFFYDRLISDSGRYIYYTDCHEHILYLSIYSVTETERFDTICDNGVLILPDTTYREAGRHRYAVPDRHQCDSVQWINLTVLPRSYKSVEDTLLLGESYALGGKENPAPGIYDVALAAANGCDSLVTLILSCIDRRDSLVCNSALPLMWDSVSFSAAGSDTAAFVSAAQTDSLVVRCLAVRYPPDVEPQVSRSCEPPAYYTVRMPAGYRYSWSSDPFDASLWNQQPDTLAQLTPAHPTKYYITSDYMDAPSCPSVYTLPLEPLHFLVADLFVSPRWLSADQLDLLGADQSEHSTGRQWFVDGQRQWEEGREFRYTADAKADSVVLMLLVDNGSCEDRVTQVVPIYHYSLDFPNVFTPDAETNNRFGCSATNIDNYGLWIYDRRGALVFSTHDQRETWDGTANGIPCQQAAYTYHCQYSIPVAGMQTKVGTVLLLR